MAFTFDKIAFKEDRPLVFILSGAGLSAESGIPTFRDENGLWKQYKPQELATVNALRANPETVFEFYNHRIEFASKCRPNAAHIALAQFQRDVESFCDVIHVTQNVDNLNEQAGSPRVFHLHGDFQTSKCSACKKSFPRLGLYHRDRVCPICGAKDYSVRPSVVLFGEEPYGMDWIFKYLEKSCAFISVGTSGVVYPAASFVSCTKANYRINLNLVNDSKRGEFTHLIEGPCTETLPPLLKDLKTALIDKATLSGK